MLHAINWNSVWCLVFNLEWNIFSHSSKTNYTPYTHTLAGVSWIFCIFRKYLKFMINPTSGSNLKSIYKAMSYIWAPLFILRKKDFVCSKWNHKQKHANKQIKALYAVCIFDFVFNHYYSMFFPGIGNTIQSLNIHVSLDAMTPLIRIVSDIFLACISNAKG